jgi:hypothetical protein
MAKAKRVTVWLRGCALRRFRHGASPMMFETRAKARIACHRICVHYIQGRCQQGDKTTPYSIRLLG